MLVLDERIKDGWHHEVSNSTSGVAKSSCQCVCSSNDILIEETGTPNLAGNERSTQNTNEESKSNETFRCCNETSHRSGDSSRKQTADENISRTKAIAKRTGNGTDDQSTSETHDVRVGIVVLSHLEIFSDGEGQQWREGIPGQKCHQESRPGVEESSAIFVDGVQDRD